MKKYMAIFMSILVMMVSVFTAPAGVVAEDSTGIMTAEFYTSDGKYETYEVPYTITISDNGDVKFESNKFNTMKSGNLPGLEISVSSEKEILYNSNSYYSNNLYVYGDYEYLGAYNRYYYGSIRPNVDPYMDSQGNTFYLKNNEKVYFTDTVIVEFNGITITKEIGDGNSETQIIDNSPVYGDFNSDGEVNVVDAVIILQYAAEYGAGSFTGTFEEYVA